MEGERQADQQRTKEDQRTERCHYRNCRHTYSQHGKTWTTKTTNGRRRGCKCKHFRTPKDDGREYKQNPLVKNQDFKELEQALKEYEVLCFCGEPLSPFDIVQTYQHPEEKQNIWTFVRCANCKKDWAAWKILHKIHLQSRLNFAGKDAR